VCMVRIFTSGGASGFARALAFIFFSFLFSGAQLNAQVADLVIQKTGPLTVFIGQSMSYTISIQNNGPNAANGASFVDDFPSNVSNVTLTGCVAAGGAVCPGIADYSIDDDVFFGIIPTLPNGGAVTFTISLNAPSPISVSSFSNTATVTVPAGVSDPDPNTNISTWNTSVDCAGSVTSLTPIVSPAGPLNCSAFPTSVQYTVRWVNNGPSNAAGIQLTHIIDIKGRTSTGSGSGLFNIDWSIANLSWSASGNSAIPFRRGGTPPNYTNLGIANFNNMSGNTTPPAGTTGGIVSSLNANMSPNWEPGDTITLTYTLQLSAVNYTGCGLTFNFDIETRTSITNPGVTCNTTPTATVVSTNSPVNMCTGPPCPIADVATVKTASYPGGGPLNCASFPISINYTVRYINFGPDTIKGVRMVDQVRLNNLVNIGSGNATYTFPWSISNVSWVSSGVSALPLTTVGQNPVIHNPTSGSSSPGTGPNGTLISSLPSNETSLFAPGDTITLTYTLTINQPTVAGCGRSITFTLRNAAQVNNGTGFYDDPVSGNNQGVAEISVSCDLAPPCLVADIRTQTTITGSLGCGDYPGQLQVTALWINNGPDSANGIVLSQVHGMVNRVLSGTGNATFTFPWTISNIQWYASGLSSVPIRATGAASNPNPTTGVVEFSAMSGTTTPTASADPGSAESTGRVSSLVLNIVPRFYVGDTIRLTYTINLALPNVSGCGRAINFNNYARSFFTVPTNVFVTDPVSTNNSTTALSGVNSNTATDLVISKSISPVVVNAGDTVTYLVEFQNASPVLSLDARWADSLNANFIYIPGSLTCTTLQGAPPCGVETFNPITNVLSISVGNMPANSATLYTYKGIAATNLSFESVNSRAYAYNSCFECFPNSNFSQTNFQILPVELLSFEAMLKDCIPSLKWATASEFNNSGFYVYSSVDGINWKQKGFVAGAGSSNEVQTYVFDLTDPVSEMTYYRLLQEDFDGTQAWLPISFVDPVGCNNIAVRVFPNPAKDILTFAFKHVENIGLVEFEIRDMTGKVLQVYERSVLSGDLDVSSLPEGMYLVNVVAGDFIHTEKVLIVR